MLSPQKVVACGQFSNFIKSLLRSIFLIGAFWILFIGLSYAGCPLPGIKVEKFFDLGFFAFSTFGFIIFLTMVPFQTVEGKLSPGFYSRIIRNSWAHFGLYVLLVCSIICFFVLAFYQNHNADKYLSHLFMALVAAIVFSILFHRFWVLRHLYQPYTVYKNIAELIQEESKEEVWIELLECSYKAIKDGRLSDAKNFIQLISFISQDQHKEKKALLYEDEDLRSLYTAALELRPLARYMEAKWPSLQNETSTQGKDDFKISARV